MSDFTLNFIIGTKAQFIKMAPVISAAQEKKISCRLINLTQHAKTTATLFRDFGIDLPSIQIGNSITNISSIPQALTWSARLALLSFRRQRTLQQLLFPKGGVALVHGDTLSTLFGALIAKRAGMPLAQVEAGLTSGKLFNPFPEEIIRRIVHRLSDSLFAPGAVPYQHLNSVVPRANIFNTSYNTGKDALFLSLNDLLNTQEELRYSVATVHRFETITRAAQLNRVITYLIELSKKIGLIKFFLHDPTHRALIKNNLLSLLEAEKNIQILPLESYAEFSKTLAGAWSILTDGGSIQEEASHLGKPCIILREHTERNEGLGKNAKLTSWNTALDGNFLQELPSTPVSIPTQHMDASKLIVDELVRLYSSAK